MFLSTAPSYIAFLWLLFTGTIATFAQNTDTTPVVSNHATVLILGGGMTGIIAARTLHEQGIDDFIIIDGKIDLGGRMIGHTFGAAGRQIVVELGASWIQGTQQGSGPTNPIWELALKHNLTTTYNDFRSMTTYDYRGHHDYSDVVNSTANSFAQAIIFAGQRSWAGDVDLSLKAAYDMMDASPKTPQEFASNYYQNDFSPYQTSWLASAKKYNATYTAGAGGFSHVRRLSTDQRGFSHIVQAEAAGFLSPQQLMLNHTVNLVEYSNDGILVYTAGGHTISADHVLCTFSAGVLQHRDVVFQPSLPDWKVDAIHSINIAHYTKIFLQFNETFWFSTEMGLYAAKQGGMYSVWQNLDHAGFFPGSGIIFTTVTGEWAAYVEQLTIGELQSEVMGVLRTMYPNIEVPDPIDIHVSTWMLDPLYRGSFANWGPSYFPSQSQNLKATVNNRLWFAGEATSVEYFGLLQGAYFEGQSAGYALAECVKGDSEKCNAFSRTSTRGCHKE